MRIPEYDDGFDSRTSFERADEDRPEDMEPAEAVPISFTARIEAIKAALAWLLSDVEGSVDYGMPFEDPEHGFHESVMAARRALEL